MTEKRWVRDLINISQYLSKLAGLYLFCQVQEALSPCVHLLLLVYLLGIQMFFLKAMKFSKCIWKQRGEKLEKQKNYFVDYE